MAADEHTPALASLGAGAGAAIGRHMDRAFRAMLRGGRVVEGPGMVRLLTGEPHPFGNFTLLSAPVALESARAAVEPLVAGGGPAAVMFPDLDVPDDVDAHLADLGFVALGAPAMGIDIASLEPTALPAGYTFERVGGGAEGEEWERQFAVGYELPLGVAQCFSPVAAQADTSPESTMQFFAVRRAGRIVATSACYLDGGLAGIYCVATIPEERRKGLGAYATAEPLRLAVSLGYRVGVLQSSEAGHTVYRGLGFADFGSVPLYVRMSG